MPSSLLGLLIVLAVACRPSDTSVAADVQAYLEQTRRWAPFEGEAALAVERILATQFVDEAEVRRQIADARPRIQSHVDNARKYTPRTSVVQRVHAQYVGAWEALLGSFQDILRGFDTGDYTLLARGREGMARWKAGVLAVARDLRRLIDEYDVVPAAPAAPAISS